MSNGLSTVLKLKAPSSRKRIKPPTDDLLTRDTEITLVSQPVKQLGIVERCLKSFEFHRALDLVLEMGNVGKFASVARYLTRINVLKQALSGRTEAYISRLLDFISRNLQNPRHASCLLEVAYEAIDIYSPEVGRSESLKNVVSRLRGAISRQRKIMKNLMDLDGRVRTLFIKR